VPIVTPDAPTVCGFSFGKNLTKLNYPVEAAVGSVLPVCDRFVFAVGRSEDDTRERVARIDTSRMNGGKGGALEIIDTDWPDVQVNGEVLAIEANKALAAAEATRCTWGFYIQADEVIHEDDLQATRDAMHRYAALPGAGVKALLFRYLHFVLDYETTDPWMYHKASRIMRLDGSLSIFGDACGPGLKQPTAGDLQINDGYLDKRHLGTHVRWAQGNDGRRARVFHYGWVKTRKELNVKFDMVDQLWWGTLSPEEKQRRKSNKFGRFIERYPYLKKYHGTHPALMRERLAAHPAYAKVPSRWLNPRFYAEVLKHGFHG
jgi:hypothetical protein